MTAFWYLNVSTTTSSGGTDVGHWLGLKVVAGRGARAPPVVRTGPMEVLNLVLVL